MSSALDLLPHAPPMRLVEEIVSLNSGRAVCRRTTRPDDWFFQGHFPGHPVVPAIVLVELLAQAGGLAVGADRAPGQTMQLRVAGLGPFKFPGAAGPGMLLEATARLVGSLGGLFKIEGQVTADGVLVAEGAVTLAEPR